MNNSKTLVKEFKENRIQNIITDIHNNRRCKNKKLIICWAKELIKLFS